MKIKNNVSSVNLTERIMCTNVMKIVY